MGRGQGNDRIELPCKFGTLVCEVVRNDEEYCEFAIDLVRADGRAYQVAVIGTNEWDSGDDSERVHVHLWNGKHEDVCMTFEMNPYGEGYYSEEGE